MVSQTAATTTGASSARRTVSGGRSSRHTARPTPAWSAPNTTASSGSPGPMERVSQDIPVRMNPAPNHQPRTAASRAPGAARISSRPGTSATQASAATPGAGKASTGSAPAASAASRGRYRANVRPGRAASAAGAVGPGGPAGPVSRGGRGMPRIVRLARPRHQPRGAP